ncbi:hypothetical protein [Chelativorans sp.]|uniref:hypothetical protein n=1 Tax=Chelativorans sp. TaxID=2203393 RepID=UPI0028110B33|nr:hypothetical protein [Chelativorans sp.]
MARNDQQPRGKRTDRRTVLITAVVVVIALVLFVLYDGGFRTASDRMSGGADQDAVPPQTEETAPTTPQN